MNRASEGGAAAPRRNVWVLLGLVAILGGLVAQPITAGTAGATGPVDNPAKGEDSPVTDAQDGRRSDPIPPELVGNQPAPMPASKAAVALDDIACVGNGTSGKRVQLVYAYRAGSPNRSAAYAASIRSWATQFDDYLAGEGAATGGQRRIRFVHDGACQPTVLTVQVPSSVNDFDAAAAALDAAGLTNPNRKYLTYADWNVSGLCGTATYWGDEDPSANNFNNTEIGYALTYQSCWDWSSSRTALHELFHTFGAVQGGSPNGNGGHCDDGELGGADIMCYGDYALDACDAGGPRVMDCGRDDYFNVTPVSGSYLAQYWNPTNSAYLTVPTGCAPQDSFASSYPIGGNRGTVKGSNAGCGVETGEPTHAGSRSRSVWWTYTAPSTGQVTVDTFGSAFDTVLAVYTGNTVGALTLVNSNDDTAPGSQSKVTFTATGGQRYRIAVDGWSGTTGEIKLNWKHAASPANDNLADAWVVAGANGATGGSTNGATRETGEPMHRHRGFPSVWWSWTAPSTGNLRLSTSGSNFDTVLSVYTGTDAGAAVAKAQNDDDPTSYTSEVLVPVKAGVTYRWAVSGYAGSTGAVSLNWNLQPVQCSITNSNPFSDVPNAAWYRNSVLWLVQRGITSGTGPGKYSPNAPVTRGQMAMFLWKVSGQPAANYSHGFNDVSPESYYNDAVSWLVENDVTSGTTSDIFSPNNKVSRAQMATFLWRLVGAVYPGFIHDFYDVSEGAYYDQAVAWLVRDGITAGTGPGQFSPNQNVTRAQMAAFLNIRTCG